MQGAQDAAVAVGDDPGAGLVAGGDAQSLLRQGGCERLRAVACFPGGFDCRAGLRQREALAFCRLVLVAGVSGLGQEAGGEAFLLQLLCCGGSALGLQGGDHGGVVAPARQRVTEAEFGPAGDLFLAQIAV